MKLKYMLLVLSLVGLNMVRAFAQCENGTGTNPSMPTPTNAGFKTNSFNWRQNPIPVTRKFVGGSNLNNPFFSVAPNYLSALQGGLDSDSKPEDGWELIKQDFGFAYASNTWNGQSIFNATGGEQQGRAYMMLYNKYTTSLRVIGVMDRLQLNQQLVVVLSVKKQDNSKSNYADLKFNALFNQYNAVETALDEKTKVVSVTAPAQVPPTNTDFFYADFKLTYDPCVCFFKSALEVGFQVKETSTLKLTGRILGQNVDIASKNALPNPDYITSVWNNDVPNQPYNQQYGSIGNLRNELINGSGGDVSALDNLLKGLKIAKAVYAAPSLPLSVVSQLSGEYLKMAKYGKELTKSYDLLSLFSDSKSEKSSPSVITADVAATGTITTTSTVNGNNILIGMPGSKDAVLLPEYPVSAPTSQGIKPMYPMYNEALGNFAFVKTPVVHFAVVPTSNAQNCAPYCSYLGTLAFKLADDVNLSYAFGPLVDVEKTKVFVGLQLSGSGSNGAITSQFLPIDKAKNIYAFTGFNFGVSNGGILPGINITSDQFKIVFQIFYVFKPDANGKVQTGFDMIKAKVSTVGNDAIKSDSRLDIARATPTDLNLTQNTYAAGQTIYSFGDITITGSQINQSSSPIIIIAQGNVNISPGVSLTGNIQIVSGQQFPPGFNAVVTPVPPMSASAVQSFCTSNEYKAKDVVNPITQPINNDAQLLRSVPQRLFVAPNPFNNLLSVQYELQEPTQVTVSLSNALGQVVKVLVNEKVEAGSYQINESTADLPTGVYIVTMRTPTGIKTQKVVKQNQ